MADRITVDGSEYELVTGVCKRDCELSKRCVSGHDFFTNGMSECLVNNGRVWQKCDPSAKTVDTACQQGVSCAATGGTEQGDQDMNWKKKSEVGLLETLSDGTHKIRVYADRLAIWRVDGERLTWDELQAVKQDVWGDCVAVEVYPCGDEVVNIKNTRHLWTGQLIEKAVDRECRHAEFGNVNRSSRVESSEDHEPMPNAETLTDTDMIAAAALIRQCRAKATDYRTGVIKRHLIAIWDGYATVVERLLAIAQGKALTCDGCQRLAHRSVLPACQSCRRMPREDGYAS